MKEEKEFVMSALYHLSSWLIFHIREFTDRVSRRNNSMPYHYHPTSIPKERANIPVRDEMESSFGVQKRVIIV